MSDLETWLRDLSGIGTTMFEKFGRVNPPFYVIVDADGNRGTLPVPPNLNKDRVIWAVRQVFKKKNVVRYLWTCEAWTLEGTGEKPLPSDLEHVPGRKEVLMFSAEDKDQGMLMARREIIRDPAPRLGPLVVDKSYTRMEGRMVGLLPGGNKQ